MRRMTVILALLLVAGCGQAERPYQPQGAPSPAEEAAAPTAGTSDDPAPTDQPAKSTTDAAGTETIAVADGVKMRVEWPAKRDPLLELATRWYLGVRRAIVTGDYDSLPEAELEAVRDADSLVKEFNTEKMSIRGVGRLYDLRVAVTGKGAKIDACVDETDIRLIRTATGKAVSPQPDWVRVPYLQSAFAHRGDDGVWRIRSVESRTEGCER